MREFNKLKLTEKCEIIFAEKYNRYKNNKLGGAKKTKRDPLERYYEKENNKSQQR